MAITTDQVEASKKVVLQRLGTRRLLVSINKLPSLKRRVCAAVIETPLGVCEPSRVKASGQIPSQHGVQRGWHSVGQAPLERKAAEQP